MARRASLDLFDGRPQLIVYRAFFEPGVYGWPEHACRGCSMVADHVGHLAHLNARGTTLVFASRAAPADIARVKARMGWTMPWYTITDDFDIDFGVDQWHGTNAFIRDGDRVFRTYLINNRGDEALGTTWSYLDMTALGRQETWEDSPAGYPQTSPYEWWNWHDEYGDQPGHRRGVAATHRRRRRSGTREPLDRRRPLAAPRDRPRRRDAPRGGPAPDHRARRVPARWSPARGSGPTSDAHARRRTSDLERLTVARPEARSTSGIAGERRLGNVRPIRQRLTYGAVMKRHLSP